MNQVALILIYFLQIFIHTGPEYFLDTATHMYIISPCEGMNEDYIRMGRIKDNVFEEFTSSQKYT